MSLRHSIAATFLAYLLMGSGASQAQPSAFSPLSPSSHGQGGVDLLEGFDAEAPIDPRYAGILLDVALLPSPSSTRLMGPDAGIAEPGSAGRIFRLPSLDGVDAFDLGLHQPTGDPQSMHLPGSGRLSWGLATYDAHSADENKTLGSLLLDQRGIAPLAPADRWTDSLPGEGLILYFTLHGSSGGH